MIDGRLCSGAAPRRIFVEVRYEGNGILFAALTAAAQSPVPRTSATDIEKIADARKAAPELITQGATILDWPAIRGGQYRVLRNGLSETDLPAGAPPGSTQEEPAPFDRVFFQWLNDGVAGGPQHLERLGVVYRYMGAWISNACGKTGEKEFHVGPTLWWSLRIR